MLFNSILIAMTYIIWFVVDILVIYFKSHERISAQQALDYEGYSRIVRLVFQFTAFCWILLTFSRYGMAVDEKMERQRRKSSVKKQTRKTTIRTSAVQADAIG